MVAVFTGAAQHEDGQDGHDDAAEGAGAEDGVDETDEAAVSQEDWRDDDEGQAAGSRTDVRFRFKAQAVDHIGQEAFGNGPERCEHGTESESVDDDEEDRRSQGTAPGQGCDFRNFIDWQHEEDRQGDQRPSSGYHPSGKSYPDSLAANGRRGNRFFCRRSKEHQY